MGTKNNPGKFDCYEQAADDEPMFVLLARDEQAPERVRDWARLRAARLHKDMPNLSTKEIEQAVLKIAEAFECASAMEQWRRDTFTRKCSRPEPHKCGVNGPCNGIPREAGMTLVPRRPAECTYQCLSRGCNCERYR